MPAAEIEQIVIAGARQLLDDQTAVLDAIQTAELVSNQIPAMMRSAREWKSRLESDAECMSALALLVDRVDLSPEGFRIALKLPTHSGETTDATIQTPIAVSRFIPMQIKRRGVELRLVFNRDRGKTRKADPALLKAIARAHRWFDDLVSGRVRSRPKSETARAFPKTM